MFYFVEAKAQFLFSKIAKYQISNDEAVSTISNGREPKSYLGRVFNSKLDHTAILFSKCTI